MKQFKKIIALICVLATLVLLIQAPTASAKDYHDPLDFNTEYSYILDEDDFHFYYFELNQKTEVTLYFSCNYPIDVTLDKYDYLCESYDEFFSRESKQYINKTLTLKKGEYCVSIYGYYEDYYDYDYECDCCDDCWWECDYDECLCDCPDCYDDFEYEECDYLLEVSTTYAKKIKFDKSKLNMKQGETKTLTVSATPKLSYYSALTWTSSNPKVATVNEKGKVTAVDFGKTTIVAKDENGKKAKCNVVVNNKTIKIHKNSLSTLPKINGKKQGGWISKSPSVATADSGSVYAKAKGTTTIYKKVKGVTYSCTIKVVDPSDLLSKGTSKLKAQLYYPSYFSPQSSWKGYLSDETPAVLLKYRAKTLGGWMITEYAIFSYNGSSVKYESYSSMPSKKKFKNKVIL